jgi:hypothetical protein
VIFELIKRGQFEAALHWLVARKSEIG